MTNLDKEDMEAERDIAQQCQQALGRQVNSLFVELNDMTSRRDALQARIGAMHEKLEGMRKVIYEWDWLNVNELDSWIDDIEEAGRL